MSLFKKMKKSEPMDMEGPKSLPVALGMQRQSKKKKMARGGIVEGEHDKMDIAQNSGKKPLEKAGWVDDTYSEQASKSFSKSPKEAEDYNFHNQGRATIDESDSMEDEMMSEHTEHNPDDIHSVADAIMESRRAKRYADGGMVDIESNEEEESADLSPYDKRNEAVMKEHYGDDLDSMHQPEDSNEHGDDIDSDVHDMVSQIRKQMMAKRGMR